MSQALLRSVAGRDRLESVRRDSARANSSKLLSALRGLRSSREADGLNDKGELETMPVASLPDVMDRAFEKRYGVAAFNTVDDITMHGVISAAEQSKSPLIVQISVKTVKFWGAEVIKHMFTDMATRAKVPVALHLDHCPDPAIAKACLEVGWNSVLFDGSGMTFEDNQKLTKEIVSFATTRD